MCLEQKGHLLLSAVAGVSSVIAAHDDESSLHVLINELMWFRSKSNKGCLLMHLFFFSCPSLTWLPLKTAVFQFLSCTFIPCFRGNAAAVCVCESLWCVSLCTLRDANRQPLDASSHTPDPALPVLLWSHFHPEASTWWSWYLRYVRISPRSRKQPLLLHHFYRRFWQNVTIGLQFLCKNQFQFLSWVLNAFYRPLVSDCGCSHLYIFLRDAKRSLFIPVEWFGVCERMCVNHSTPPQLSQVLIIIIIIIHIP